MSVLRSLERLTELEKIQPETKNIWTVLPKEQNIRQRYFIFTQQSFANIFKDINEFVSSKNITQFKIFKN